MKRTDRMFAIVVDLQARPIVRAEDLAARFETSVRTIYRDVLALCEAGIPIVSLPGQGYALPPGFFLPPLSFALDEVAGLLLGADYVAQTLDPSYRAAARAAIRKLEAIVPAALRGPLAEARRTTLLIGSAPAEPQLALLGELRVAIGQRRIVRIRYRGQRTDDAAGRGDAERRIAPYALANVRGRWYVVGHSYERGAPRRFRLSRIVEAHVGDETFELPADFAWAAPDREDEAPVLVRIAFPASELEVMTERLSGFDATLQIAGASGIAAFRTHSEASIVPYVLGWGGSVRVIEPVALRDRIVAEARRIIANVPDIQLSGAPA